MNAVIALCHFCEIHGPRVLFCTQAHHAAEPQHVLDGKGDEFGSTFGHHFHKRPRSSTNESLSSMNSDMTTCSSASSTEHCEACRSFQPGQPGFISNDHEAKISYISSQNPEHPELFTIIRQACIRSLSCEICQGREGPIFFGDDYYGYTLSYMFFIKDTQARGLQRGYSIIVVMMDKIYLLNSWPFLVKHMKSLIDELQEKANKVYEQEQTQRNQRADRLNREFLSPGDFYRGGVNKPFRALVVLTGDPNLFRYLHMRFSWILKAGGNRMMEKVLEGPPQEEAVDLDDQEVTEEGFIKISAKPLPLTPSDSAHQEGHQSEEELDADEGPIFTSLQHFRAVLGSLAFHDVAYNVLTGNQLIARCDNKSTLKSLFKVLKVILPAGCCRIISHSSAYQDSWKCNFLGLTSDTQLPEHVMTSELYLLLDIIGPDKLKQDSNRVVARMAGPFKGYGISITSSSVVPDKVPTILSRIEMALDNSDLTPEIVVTVLTTFKEEWMNKVKLLFKFTRAGSHSEEDVEKLLKVLHANHEDKPLLRFWVTGLSSQYRSHLLTTTMGTT